MVLEGTWSVTRSVPVSLLLPFEEWTQRSTPDFADEREGGGREVGEFRGVRHQLD